MRIYKKITPTFNHLCFSQFWFCAKALNLFLAASPCWYFHEIFYKKLDAIERWDSVAKADKVKRELEKNVWESEGVLKLNNEVSGSHGELRGCIWIWHGYERNPTDQWHFKLYCCTVHINHIKIEDYYTLRVLQLLAFRQLSINYPCRSVGLELAWLTY